MDALDPLTDRVVPLFNPRRQRWSRHFKWDGPPVVGKTAVGRATVRALQLSNQTAMDVRRNWMSVGWHPPDD